MLKGLHSLLVADLLHALAAMGHGDEIAVVDANFPAASVGRRVIGLPGASAPEALAAILTVLPLDTAVTPAAFTMRVVGDPDAVPAAVADFAAVFTEQGLGDSEIGHLERRAFYDRAHEAFAIVHTGEFAALWQHPARQGRRQRLSVSSVEQQVVARSISSGGKIASCHYLPDPPAMAVARFRTLVAIVVAAFAVALPLPARAVDYTDIWWAPCAPGPNCDIVTGHENGWGVNFVQNEDVVFATFYVYDANKQPIWVSSPMFVTAGGSYSGDLNLSTGSFFGGPWTGSSATKVGSATFTPTSASTGILTYNVSNVPGIPNSVVTKNIDRSTFRTIVLGGSYNGGQAGAYSGCSTSASNGPYIDRYDLTVSHDTIGGVVTLSFKFIGGLSCVFSGALQQSGQLYSVPSASYVCSDGLNTNASLSEVKATSLGIEGRFSAPNVGGGCREDASFSAVLQ